jgi:hypothetical protein
MKIDRRAVKKGELEIDALNALMDWHPTDNILEWGYDKEDGTVYVIWE